MSCCGKIARQTFFRPPFFLNSIPFFSSLLETFSSPSTPPAILTTNSFLSYLFPFNPLSLPPAFSDFHFILQVQQAHLPHHKVQQICICVTCPPKVTWSTFLSAAGILAYQCARELESYLYPPPLLSSCVLLTAEKMTSTDLVLYL